MSANRRARLVLWAWTHVPEDTTIGIRGQWSIHALVKQYWKNSVDLVELLDSEKPIARLGGVRKNSVESKVISDSWTDLVEPLDSEKLEGLGGTFRLEEAKSGTTVKGWVPHQWILGCSRMAGEDLGNPSPICGHTSVNIGKSKIVVFGGLVDKKFLSDIAVFDIENGLWFQPECTGIEFLKLPGQSPSPRCGHTGVAQDSNKFVFGSRVGERGLVTFWVLSTVYMAMVGAYQFGDLPSPRDFAAASAIGNRKIVMYGGWDGKKWLSDVFILDTNSLEWMELSVSGSLPPPRCGHTATMVEKRFLVYGGRGGGGPIMGGLWALKGLIEEVRHKLKMEENETPGWTQLKLPGQSPSPRCGHTVTSGGHYLLLFGGHGTGGWLSRYDIYHNDTVVLDRVSVHWKRLTTTNDPPPARAYHSVTCIGSRYLLFGGFDGKMTYGDLWWLVPEDAPLTKNLVESKVISGSWTDLVEPLDSEKLEGLVLLWRSRMKIEVSGEEKKMSGITSYELVKQSRKIRGAFGTGTWAFEHCFNSCGETFGSLTLLLETGKLLCDLKRFMALSKKLKLPGQSPSPRCGHTVTSGGHYFSSCHISRSRYLLRYDIYHNDTVVLDRELSKFNFSCDACVTLLLI
ncbi:hypothetical protein LguiA_016711 [Lonicera macranthoides]